MNFVYISPHFPAVMQNFCIALRENGVTVLGIGDAPYETLSDSLRGALQEYYRVNDMENYDQMSVSYTHLCATATIFCRQSNKMARELVVP